MRIHFVNATNEDRYFIMEVRNAGRLNMTHDQSYITPEMQDDWWFAADQEFRKLWIVHMETDDGLVPVGFCMLREHYDSGRIYGTLALKPEYQNMGIGTAIYRFMTEKFNEVWIDVLNTNLPSLKAAIKVGFRIYDQNPRITVLVYRA